MFGVFFLGALYLQRILGYDALEVGLAFLPSTVVMAALSLGVAGRLERSGSVRSASSRPSLPAHRGGARAVRAGAGRAATTSRTSCP